MQAYIHEQGAENAQGLAARAQSLGIKDKFNDDPLVSVETFPIAGKYTFLKPTENTEDAELYANLIRMCVHFEIETLAFMQVMGFDARDVYPPTVKKFMAQNAIDSLKVKFTSVNPVEFESLANDIAADVYKYLQSQLDLPPMNW